MKVSELIESMSAAGAPMEAILIAIRAIEEGQDAIDARRASERERKRRQRAKDNDAGGTVTGQSRDSHKDIPLSLPPNEKISNPPTHTPENNKPARVKGSRLPADWQPKTLTGDAGVAVRSWPAGSVDRELARFRDWAASATGPNALKTDWDAAWRNWIRKAEDDGRYGSRQSGRTAPGAPGSFLASLGASP